MAEIAAPVVSSAPLRLAEAARLPVADVLERLGTTATGLSQAEAERRLATSGRNVLATHRVTAFGVLLRQLRNPLLILLVSAAAVSGATGDPTDAAIITAIVVLSVGLGFVNEYRSERAVAALHANIRHEALVTRDGGERRVDVRDLVPGDIVALRIGDVVPADMRLLETTRFECDEAVLTGESMPAAKAAAAAAASDSEVDLSSCAFMGTIVHQGSARGRRRRDRARRRRSGRSRSGSARRQAATAFQVGLNEFSKLLVRVAGILTVSIFVINVALSRPIIDALLFSLAIAIGITPQLLPAIVSVSLAAGSRQLARRKVLVKRLVTIEDLGNIQVLFTDKTGTLTEGAITLHRVAGRRRRGLRSIRSRLGLVCNEATMTATGPVGGNVLDQALWTAPDAAAVRAGPDGPEAVPPRRHPAVRPRAAAGVGDRDGPGRRDRARHEGRARGGARSLRRRARRRRRRRSTACSRDGARVVAVATRRGAGRRRPAPAGRARPHLRRLPHLRRSGPRPTPARRSPSSPRSASR